MRIKNLFLLVLPLLFAIIPAPAPTATEQTKFKFRGESVAADFVSTQNCIETIVSIFAFKDATKETNFPSVKQSQLVVTIAQTEVCETGSTIMFGSDISSDVQLKMGGSLNDATVTGTVALLDLVNARTTHVTVNLTFTPTAPAVRDKTNLTLNQGSVLIKLHSDGEFRTATATGTVETTLTDHHNLTPNPSVEGFLFDGQVGDMTITKRSP